MNTHEYPLFQLYCFGTVSDTSFPLSHIHDQVKRGGGAAYGAMWWMDRELKEAQKYMPKRKQQQ